ncbi:hypothetical protein [Vibrio splendidus]|uniref:hypothetical protein n=1 Tax=Vibrio splendidus TaxID=29497 RepID=UPI0034A0CF11
MTKIIIIDDDVDRHELIKRNVIDVFNLSEEQVDSAYSLSEARLSLRKVTYTVVFLDMALPNYSDNKKDINPWAGVKILKEIASGKVASPEKVIGYTALDENLEEKEREFSGIGFTLDYATSHDISWLSKRKSTIDYSLQRSKLSKKVEKDFAILTVHGIRTFGSWQERLFNEVRSEFEDKKVEHLEFKFTGIDFFTFLVPSFRKKIIERLVSELETWFAENKAKEIYCFSHSFGTYITVKALEKMQTGDGIESIKYLVLSGSVLDQDYDFSNLKHLNDIKVINDCAVSDIPLLFSEGFVLDAGMAGITGFRCISANKVKNRYFSGGHSVFFDSNAHFIRKNWLPLFSDKIVTSDSDVKVGILQEIFMVLVRILSKVKAAIPIIIPVVGVLLGYKWYF